MTAVYNAYDGEKEFIQENWGRPDRRIYSDEFSVMVADDFVPYSPGKLIMLTHGASGGKTYGLRQPFAYHNEQQARLIDYVVSTSEDTRALEAEQHGVPIEKVLPLGMPRMDDYFGKKRGDGGTGLTDKRVYLYAPTFRKPFEPHLSALDWWYIDDQLSDDEIFVVKRHMVTKPPLVDITCKHIVEVSPELPSTPYLIDCNVLITDYSSILFDGQVLGKPVILIEKDRDFIKQRGMSFPYPDGYASRHVTHEAELIAAMRLAYKQGPEDIKCRERACGACDGHATERVVDLIRSCV